MSSFTTELVIKPLDDGERWELVQPFRYRIGGMDSQNIITVPAGSITDFASVPRVLWPIFPPWGKYGKAAVLHDNLYNTGIFTRKESDDIFLEAMEVLGVNWFTRRIIYSGVRVGGWKPWGEYRREEKK